jgi:outer membrane protein assembly factor BamB
MTQKPANWWMFHGDPEHSGFVSTSSIDSSTVAGLKVLQDVALDGPVLSTPAIADGFIYVGTANSHEAVGANGGSFYKIDIATGGIAAVFHWDIAASERDTHGFCGMGCTPAVADGKVYFSAFNGKLYCLDQETLAAVWITDLRYADPLHNQPVTNDLGTEQGAPVVAGWSSPVVANGRVYVGMGEGENPFAYGFVYCLDGQSGDVVWLFCTCQFQANQANAPNVLPAELADGNPPPGFTVFSGNPVSKGCSVWAGIAYDATLDRLYCSTGNPQPDGQLPTPGYSNGLLTLNAATGAFVGFVQFPPSSSYRVTDIDVDVGGAATLFTSPQGRRLVGLGCKNGSYMVMDADTLEILQVRQMLPYHADGSWIATVDPHSNSDEMNPRVSNEESNSTQGENYSGTYSTAAVHAATQRLFIGLGGNNYHALAPGIDTDNTPFLRALDWNTLADAWPVDGGDPPRYVNGRPPLYANATESGLGVPAVVNDVVFMATTQINVYAFDVADGKLLWQDQIGSETGGYNGGYGYCLGPAVWGNYVVAGALVYGREGGVLRIYKLPGS